MNIVRSSGEPSGCGAGAPAAFAVLAVNEGLAVGMSAPMKAVCAASSLRGMSATARYAGTCVDPAIGAGAGRAGGYGGSPPIVNGWAGGYAELPRAAARTSQIR